MQINKRNTIFYFIAIILFFVIMHLLDFLYLYFLLVAIYEIIVAVLVASLHYLFIFIRASVPYLIVGTGFYLAWNILKINSNSSLTSIKQYENSKNVMLFIFYFKEYINLILLLAPIMLLIVVCRFELLNNLLILTVIYFYIFLGLIFYIKRILKKYNILTKKRINWLVNLSLAAIIAICISFINESMSEYINFKINIFEYLYNVIQRNQRLYLHFKKDKTGTWFKMYHYFKHNKMKSNYINYKNNLYNNNILNEVNYKKSEVFNNNKMSIKDYNKIMNIKNYKINENKEHLKLLNKANNNICVNNGSVWYDNLNSNNKFFNTLKFKKNFNWKIMKVHLNDLFGYNWVDYKATGHKILKIKQLLKQVAKGKKVYMLYKEDKDDYWKVKKLKWVQNRNVVALRNTIKKGLFNKITAEKKIEQIKELNLIFFCIHKDIYVYNSFLKKSIIYLNFKNNINKETLLYSNIRDSIRDSLNKKVILFKLKIIRLNLQHMVYELNNYYNYFIMHWNKKMYIMQNKIGKLVMAKSSSKKLYIKSKPIVFKEYSKAVEKKNIYLECYRPKNVKKILEYKNESIQNESIQNESIKERVEYKKVGGLVQLSWRFKDQTLWYKHIKYDYWKNYLSIFDFFYYKSYTVSVKSVNTNDKILFLNYNQNKIKSAIFYKEDVEKPGLVKLNKVLKLLRNARIYEEALLAYNYNNWAKAVQLTQLKYNKFIEWCNIIYENEKTLQEKNMDYKKSSDYDLIKEPTNIKNKWDIFMSGNELNIKKAKIFESLFYDNKAIIGFKDWLSLVKCNTINKTNFNTIKNTFLDRSVYIKAYKKATLYHCDSCKLANDQFESFINLKMIWQLALDTSLFLEGDPELSYEEILDLYSAKYLEYLEQKYTQNKYRVLAGEMDYLDQKLDIAREKADQMFEKEFKKWEHDNAVIRQELYHIVKEKQECELNYINGSFRLTDEDRLEDPEFAQYYDYLMSVSYTTLKNQINMALNDHAIGQNILMLELYKKLLIYDTLYIEVMDELMEKNLIIGSDFEADWEDQATIEYESSVYSLERWVTLNNIRVMEEEALAQKLEDLNNPIKVQYKKNKKLTKLLINKDWDNYIWERKKNETFFFRDYKKWKI